MQAGGGRRGTAARSRSPRRNTRLRLRVSQSTASSDCGCAIAPRQFADWEGGGASSDLRSAKFQDDSRPILEGSLPLAESATTDPQAVLVPFASSFSATMPRMLGGRWKARRVQIFSRFHRNDCTRASRAGCGLSAAVSSLNGNPLQNPRE